MLADYISYFENIAEHHTAILHSPADNNPNGNPGKVKFTIFDLEDLYSNLRTKVGSGILLALNNYEWKGSDNAANDFRANATGAFLILKDTRPNDMPDQKNSYIETEQVMLDIINKLYLDSHDHCTATPFKNLDLSDFEITPAGPVFGKYYGWYVEFKFQLRLQAQLNIDLRTDLAKWTL